MKPFDRTRYQETGNALAIFCTKFLIQFPEAERKAVEHYLAVEEFEMACELFSLHLIKLQLPITETDLVALRGLAKSLDLDKASVYETDFWVQLSSLRSSPEGNQSK